MDYKKYIREVLDFPIKWVSFKDITPLLLEPEVFKSCIDDISKNLVDADIILWLDARWFIFASGVAYKLWKPFSIVRKAWKLPFKTISIDYELEYWKNTFELHIDTIKPWFKVAIIDDLLATWGTALASCKLVEKLWWEVHSLNFVVNLEFLEWNKKLSWYNIKTLVNYV